MTLFAGHEKAYGTHGHTNVNEAKNGKLEIKKTASTVRGEVTEELWDAHLNGKSPLGIIPIREDHHCFWGCIDVDKYDVSHAELVQSIDKMRLPLVVCRSKSGGAHLFLFLSEPVPAADLQQRLREMAAGLGLGDSEIFPKQSQILSDRGDLGNWLNMPYLGGDETERYAVKSTMAGMSLKEFLDFAEGRRVSLSSLMKTKVPKMDSEGLEDGPPCLQHLTAVGFPEGSRNKGLFALGIFCKRKFPNKWKEVLEQYNRQFMHPPLPADEVAGMLKNLEKNDYHYSCSEQPIASFCNSVLCRTRKYGVGGAKDYPTISGMSILDSDPRLWFIDIEEERLELSTKQLQNYREFHAMCMDRLTVCYQMLKQDTWLAMVAQAMENAVIIEAPPEVSNKGQFLELLEDFCMNRHRGQVPEDLLLGRPWYNDEEERHYFRLRDLMAHLTREKFEIWGRNQVSQRIQEIGGKHFLNIQGRGVNVFWVPNIFQETPEIPLPPSHKEPI